MYFLVAENADPRTAEVMPVFERPYLKKNSNGHHSDPIFRVYAYEPNLISDGFAKL
jgi:hypothetical protein